MRYLKSLVEFASEFFGTSEGAMVTRAPGSATC
jgi:hypothetical protein